MIINNATNIKQKVLSKDIVALTLLSVFFLTQFYFGDSGKPQYGHYVSLITIIAYIIQYRFITLSRVNILNIFIAYIILANISWYFIDNFNVSYLWSISYWIYNYIILLLVINLNPRVISQFNNILLKAILLSYLLEIALWIIGLGRYNFQPRYNGYFNDPNQMAFWVLTTCSIYIFLSKSKVASILIYLMALLLITITLSRSAMLGVPFLTIGLIYKQEGSLLKKVIFSGVSFIALVTILIFLHHKGLFDSIIERFIIGIEQRQSQAEGRGFDILLEFPEYLIFGAGQGNYGRFSPTEHEIHSTWFGIVFYYGAFALSIFLAFIYQIFKKLTTAEKFLFLTPLLYGFTTYSARATVFWFFLAIFITQSKAATKANKI